MIPFLKRPALHVGHLNKNNLWVCPDRVGEGKEETTRAWERARGERRGKGKMVMVSCYLCIYVWYEL
jgi:hypothetical protein